MDRANLRALAHYLFSFAVLSIYGGEVCPFLDLLSVFQWVGLLTVFLGGAFIVRWFWIGHMIAKTSQLFQVKIQFSIELGIFISIGLGMAIYNMVVYQFPFGSGLKIVLGCLPLGFFTAVDLSLERERIITRDFIQSGRDLMLRDKYFPVTRKFALIATMLAFTLTGIMVLIIYRDMSLVTETAAGRITTLTHELLYEILFVSAVALLEVLNLIYSYSLNLNMAVTKQNDALKKVTDGDLESRVSVSSNDEFGQMAKYTNIMIENLKIRTVELQLTQEVTILTLASLAETRDPETGAHILRTQRYVRALAHYLCENVRFKAFLTDENITLLFKSAPLHDVGKVGVQDHILLKPGRLTAEEFEEMKNHTLYGYNALRTAEDKLGSNSFLRLAREIAYTHHEKWDGSGYPLGLAGEDIPISGRLMALADVYDALISKRVYKEAFSHEKAREIIVAGRGAHFEPDIVDAFLAIEEEFKAIAARYMDEPQEKAAA